MDPISYPPHGPNLPMPVRLSSLPYPVRRSSSPLSNGDEEGALVRSTSEGGEVLAKTGSKLEAGPSDYEAGEGTKVWTTGTKVSVPPMPWPSHFLNTETKAALPFGGERPICS